MITQDLIELLQELDPNGNLEVVVPVLAGIGGPCAKIKGASQGFDWYAGKICLSTVPGLVFWETYNYMEDMADNAGHIIYCETESKFDRYAYVCRRKPPFKPGQVVTVRRVGTGHLPEDKEEFKVKIVKQVPLSILKFPHYIVEKVETK